MSVIGQFTRRETMELTGATSNQLQYLERSELIKPTREWNGKKKPEVYYSWQQVLDIRAIRNLRETTSLQVIRKILDFFEEYQINKSLRDKRIVAINEEVFWIDHDWSDFAERISVLKVGDRRGKGIGQYTLLVVPALRDIVDEIWDIAKQSKVIDIEDFKRRAKTEPSKAA
ncbi:MAG: MerR family transcriptional regulator [Nostoc sp. DedQUE08]|uniref:MerR family transcriptional regulator n=1 Tax=unclassified Nostoc TaxID=2593658 RepID=UPI002AD36A9E|nr:MULTISPECIES: MerR family transcriptional regulator [unclassified Nostoc]MDZ8069445.1 MerR family transcriptional regulator [Nostoc sp. DedQUE08]MDZ8095794.1 MerR family transcriptional regulator [Nostoc sp. DedQUE05]